MRPDGRRDKASAAVAVPFADDVEILVSIAESGVKLHEVAGFVVSRGGHGWRLLSVGICGARGCVVMGQDLCVSGAKRGNDQGEDERAKDFF